MNSNPSMVITHCLAVPDAAQPMLASTREDPP